MDRRKVPSARNPLFRKMRLYRIPAYVQNANDGYEPTYGSPLDLEGWSAITGIPLSSVWYCSAAASRIASISSILANCVRPKGELQFREPVVISDFILVKPF